jgi:F5/8 type C domain/Right handed beta helix region
MSLSLTRRILPPALACAALLAAASPAAAGTPIPGDLAYGHPTVASSIDPGFPPSRTVDADANTAWGSLKDQLSSQWMYVDLGAAKTVDRVTIDWSYSYASKYEIQTSADAKSWSTAATVALPAEETRTTTFTARSARYLRILVTERARSRAAITDLAVTGPAPAAGQWVAPWRAGVLPAPLGASLGAVRMVAPWGSDGNSGSVSAPWRSVGKALSAALPGERVLVRAGTYAGTLGAGASMGGAVGPAVYGSPRGTAVAPITVQAYPGERPVIAAMVSLPSAQYFRLSGFIIDGALAPSGAQGVSLGNTTGAAPSHVEISYNEIRNFGPVDDHAQGILHYSGTDTALVGNWIHHIGRQQFYDHGIYMKAGRRVVVANNVISDITGGYGLHIWGDFDDSWVINNTVYASAASGFTIGGNSDRGYPDRTVAADNIFAAHSGTADAHQGYAAKEYQPGAGDSVRHNLGWANARSSPWALSASGPLDNQTIDPRFADAARRDLRLQAGSPAIDSGEDFGLLLDTTGRARTGRPDKGAYEGG